nr:hypothetical protein Cry52Nrm3_p154 [Cryptomonas curvata]
MFWIKKFEWWIGLNYKKAIFFKKSSFLNQYYLDIINKKKIKNLNKIFPVIYFVTKLDYFHIWTLICILKSWKSKFLCQCNKEFFLFDKKLKFFKIKLHSKNNQENFLKKFQLHNKIPFYIRISFSHVNFLISRLNLNISKFHGLEIDTFGKSLKIKNRNNVYKKTLSNIYFFNKLKQLSFVGVFNINQNFFFKLIWNKNLMFMSIQKNWNLNFSAFLYNLIFNYTIFF